MILEEIKKYTQEVSRYRTERPDIIFKNNKGQTIALEIETGFEFNKRKM